MKKLILIFIIIILANKVNAQCEICGLYEGNTKQRSQQLTINADSTFEYFYRDNWATLMASTTRGRWRIVGNELVLNSEFNDEEFEVFTDKIDLCLYTPIYLKEVCNDIIKIQVVNLKDEYIWFLKSVMINMDTSKISAIGFEDLENFDESQVSCFIESDSISQINIFNGFYDEFVISINKPDVNYVKIKGNFADELWYTYLKRERWRVKKNKLVKNKKFGKFVKK